MEKLFVIPSHGQPFEFDLEGDSVVIGRSPELDLSLADAGLSRVHTKLSRRGNSWYAEDMGSSNGTLVNSVPIDDGQTLLKPGDELRLSDCRILFQTDEDGAEARVEVSKPGQETIFRPIAELMQENPALIDSSRLSDPDDLRRKADRLELLVEVHQALGESIELQPLLELILERAFEHLKPQEGVIYLRQSEDDYVRAAYRTSAADESHYVYSHTLVREVAEKGLAALVLDMGTDERFAGAASIQASGIRSLVAAPLIDADGPLGMIALSSRFQARNFEESDMELLVALASVASLRIRNVALAEEAAERKRMENELKMARDIQESVLPASLPEISGYGLFGVNQPSRGVSGDYYKAFVRKEGGELVLMIADVCGKGMAAALLTASLEALSAGPIEDEQSIEEICRKVCSRLHARTPITKFATVFLAVLDLESGRADYVNAGHNEILLVRADGSVEILESQGVPMGVMDDVEYSIAQIEMRSGDLVVLYTDGITEATDPDNNMYGMERLLELLLENRADPLDELSMKIDQDVVSFAQGVPFADDRTWVLLRRDLDNTGVEG